MQAVTIKTFHAHVVLLPGNAPGESEDHGFTVRSASLTAYNSIIYRQQD